MRLSLRNLLWLTLLLAIGMAWGVEHFRADARLQDVRQESGPEWRDFLERKRLKPPTASWLAELSDRDLLEQILGRHDFSGLEPYLLEANRRGMKQEITNAYAKLRQDSGQTTGFLCGLWVDQGEQRNADCLTALRRAYSKPDPIKISIVRLGVDTDGGLLAKPMIVPCLENADVERESCTIASRRPTNEFPRISLRAPPRLVRADNWQLLLTNARGELMEQVAVTPYFGNYFCSSNLAYGEKMDGDELDARRYLKPPPSGRYTLQLVYDHDESLVDADLSQRIVWKSEPVPVIVTNRTLSSQWEAVVTPNVILCSTLGTMVVLGVLTYRKRVSPRAYDWLALAVLALLATSWSLDLFRIKDEIAERTVDANAAWSMQLAK